jgi:histidinol dehydrogenase
MFQKTMSVLELGQESVSAIAPVVECLARLEGLDAHRLAMAMRREKAVSS